MKNLLYGTLFLALVGIAFVGCEKADLNFAQEFNSDYVSNIDYSSVKKVQRKGAKLTNGRSGEILKFNTFEDFESTLGFLETETNQLDSAFINFYFGLSEDEINEKEDEIGFDEDLISHNFNDHLNFFSLRKKIIIEELAWLESEELNFENDPNNHFISDEALQSVLNVESEVQIGDTIYKFVDGGYFAIASDDYKKIFIIDSDAASASLMDGFNYRGEPIVYKRSSDECIGSRKQYAFKKNSDGSKRIKWQIRIATPLFGHRYVSAKTVVYKKRKRRGWKKYRTSITSKVYGFVSNDGECKNKFNFNPNNNSLSYNKKKRAKHKIKVNGLTKSGWVKGYHKAGGITYNSVLSW